jgi:deazaflavin-dependent oxidoreductase (nitroreductase family)
VPDGAWLAPGYAEWAPPAALRGMVACLWVSIAPEDASRDALILPDACCDLIWEQGTGSYVAGPDTGPVRISNRSATTTVGVRFRPTAGGPALGLPLSEIRDQRVVLTELLPPDRLPAATRQLAAALPADLDPATAARKILDLAGTLVSSGEPDDAVRHAASLLRDPAARLEHVTAAVDLSERQLRRRFHDAVGYGPKTLQRVYRFQRFVQRIDGQRIHGQRIDGQRIDRQRGGGQPGSLDLATIAAEAGYADQAHLTRECVALSGLTPAALARARGLRRAQMPRTESASVTRPLAAYAARLLRVRWLVRAPIWVYRARLGFVFGSRLLMLEHTGRNTGARRLVVLEVVGHPRRGTYIVASGFGARAQWFRNVRASSRVRVWAGRRMAVPAAARLLGTDEAADALAAYAARHPLAWAALRAVLETTLGAGAGGREPALPLVALDLDGSPDVPEQGRPWLPRG